MKSVIVLAMHGSPPRDFPQHKMGELMALHGRLAQLSGPEKAPVLQRYHALDAEIRNWPRSPENDPFHVFSTALAQELAATTGNEVIVGYNEFCAPELRLALGEAARRGAGRIIVVTPMMTRGGEHAEMEIPAIIQEFRHTHPQIETIYAWPFEKMEIALFLQQHIARFLPGADANNTGRQP